MLKIKKLTRIIFCLSVITFLINETALIAFNQKEEISATLIKAFVEAYDKDAKLKFKNNQFKKPEGFADIYNTLVELDKNNVNEKNLIELINELYPDNEISGIWLTKKYADCVYEKTEEEKIGPHKTKKHIFCKDYKKEACALSRVPFRIGTIIENRYAIYKIKTNRKSFLNKNSGNSNLSILNEQNKEEEENKKDSDTNSLSQSPDKEMPEKEISGQEQQLELKTSPNDNGELIEESIKPEEKMAINQQAKPAEPKESTATSESTNKKDQIEPKDENLKPTQPEVLNEKAELIEPKELADKKEEEKNKIEKQDKKIENNNKIKKEEIIPKDKIGNSNLNKFTHYFNNIFGFIKKHKNIFLFAAAIISIPVIAVIILKHYKSLNVFKKV